MMIALKPSRPRIGDLVECLSDNVTQKAPCCGAVVASGPHGVAVDWSDGVEVISPKWSRVPATIPAPRAGIWRPKGCLLWTVG